jgi:hypothetical protein
MIPSYWCLAPPALVLPPYSLLPNLAYHCCLQPLTSGFVVVVCRRRLPPLQPLLPLRCLRHLLQPDIVLPHPSLPLNLACRSCPQPLSSATAVVHRCCRCPLPLPSTATAIIATPPSPPYLATISHHHFFSPSAILLKKMSTITNCCCRFFSVAHSLATSCPQLSCLLSLTMSFDCHLSSAGAINSTLQLSSSPSPISLS